MSKETQLETLVNAMKTLESKVSEISQSMVDNKRVESFSTLGRWLKASGVIIAMVFIAGFSYSQISQDIVMKEDFEPVRKGVENLKRMIPRIEKLETAIVAVNVGVKGLKVEVRDVGSKVDLLASAMVKYQKLEVNHRFCNRRLTDYTLQLSEFSTGIRTVKPKFPSDLERCRVGDIPQ